MVIKKSLKTNLVLLFAVIILCFFMAEGIFRLYSYMKQKDLVFEGQGLHIKLDDPKISHVLAPNLNVTRENGVLYQTNNEGFRDKDYNIIKDDNVFRIIAIGDSLTFGSSVTQSQIYPEILENKLNEMGLNTEVINMGVSGYSTISEVELFRLKGLKYKPDLVILGYVLNDIPSGATTDYNSSSQKFEHCRINIINIPVNCRLKEILSSSVFLSAVRDVFKDHDKQKDIYISYHNDPERWDALVEQVDELRVLSEDNDFKVLVVIFPILSDFDNYKWKDLHGKLESMFKDEGFYTLDIYDSFRDYDPESLKAAQGDPWHPNAFGYEIAADAIAEKVEEISYVNNNS